MDFKSLEQKTETNSQAAREALCKTDHAAMVLIYVDHDEAINIGCGPYATTPVHEIHLKCSRCGYVQEIHEDCDGFTCDPDAVEDAGRDLIKLAARIRVAKRRRA